MKKNGFSKGILVGVAGTLITVILLAAVVFATLLMTGFSFNKVFEKESEKPLYGIENEETMAKLAKIQELIDEDFLYDIDPQLVTDAMCKGLMNGLDDRYAAYFTAEEFTSYQEQTNGLYYGIGVVFIQDTETGYYRVVQVYRNSPAMEAGILPDDLITGVEGEDLLGVETEELVSRVRGQEGTSVNITIYRESDKEFHDFEVERREVECDVVEWKMLTDEIGYVFISGFETVTPKQLQEAMTDLNSQGMKALVLDLRNNPGGDLDSVLQVGEQILPKGLMLTIDYANYGKVEYNLESEDELDIPLTVLVNGNTASAAEVLTGAIKDYEKGTIVGTQTYGKGIVQSIIPLGDGSAVKMTVADYYTPKGNNIHKKGITPDYVVEAGEDAESDPQMEKALEILESELTK